MVKARNASYWKRKPLHRYGHAYRLRTTWDVAHRNEKPAWLCPPDGWTVRRINVRQGKGWYGGFPW